MGTILPLVLRRSLAGRGLLAVMALGVLVSATLLASAPIYARAMADLGLTFVIRDELSATPGTRVEFASVPLATSEGQARRDVVSQRIDERLGWFTGSRQLVLSVGRFWIAKPGEDLRVIVGQPQVFTGYEEHVSVTSGRLPKTTAPGEPLEFAMSGRGAQTAGLKVGDQYLLYENFDTCERELPREDPPPPPPPCNPTATMRMQLPAILVGIVEPIADRDPFWVIPGNYYFDPYRLQIQDAGIVVPMFGDRAAIQESFGSLFPAYPAKTTWHAYANPDVLTRANFERARDDLVSLYQELEPLGGFALSPLRDTLNSFGRSASYQQIPLTILLLEITGIALFYVGLVATLVVERQAAEIALLRGRGASMVQVATIYLFQGLLIGIPAILLAPFLAAAVTALLGLTPAFKGVSENSLLPVTVVPISFATAAAGVFLSLAALLVPALIVARKSATTVRRAESRPGAGLMQRYYLDLALAAGALLLLFELNQRGSVFTPSATGGVSTDPLLLASPALTIAAGGALVLRFYPLLLRLISKITAVAAGASIALGLAQVVRNPGQYTRLTLLLMMAVAVGTFAASYTTTANRSYRDRASYEVGADLRATAQAPFAYARDLASVDKTLGELPGVTRASAVIRTKANIGTPGQSGPEFQLLGVNPSDVRHMLWFRDDFSKATLDDLMGEIAARPIVPGKPVDGDPVSISMWAKGDDTLQQVTVWARFRDSEGFYRLVEMGPANTNGAWKELKGSIIPVAGNPPKPPLTLVAILFTEPSNRANTKYSPLLLDDITLTDRSGAVSVVDDFEGQAHWAAFATRNPQADAFSMSADAPHGGKASAVFAFRTGSGNETRGLFWANQPLPLPAVVSKSFLATAGIGQGGTVLVQLSGDVLVPIRAAAVFDLFPTTRTEDGPVVIVNRDQVLAWAETAAFSGSSALGANEVLMSLAPGADTKDIQAQISTVPYYASNVVTLSEEERKTEKNPLIAAGGSGILFVSFVAALGLVAAALLTSLLTSVRRRRVEFAVQRAMGLSRPQIFVMLALEYSVVAVAGVVTGAILGLYVGRQMLSFLDATESGEHVEPSFILQTEWAVVAAAVGGVVLIFVGALVLATRYLASTSDAQALRVE